MLCYAFCSAVGSTVRVCLRLHLPVSSFVSSKVLSDCVIHSHVASGVLLLLSMVHAFCGPVAGDAYHVLFQVVPAPLTHCFNVLQPDMPLCCLACVLICSQQGRLAHNASICFSYHAHAALLPHLSCAAAHLHQADCSDLAAAA